MTTSTPRRHAPTLLAEPVWRERARAHAERAERYTAPHRDRRSRGIEHPVEDFLFDYYSYEPRKLERWHPGAGVLLAGTAADAYLGLAAYRRYDGGVGADLDRLAERRDAIGRIRDLVARTAARTARLDCLGLHEWAMVYRTPTCERNASSPSGHS